MWFLNVFFTFSFISFLLFGVRSFESFAPQDLIISLSFSSAKTPAKIIGPITGPLPASSIPIIFAMFIEEEKAL